jgi:hypothetical protein
LDIKWIKYLLDIAFVAYSLYELIKQIRKAQAKEKKIAAASGKYTLIGLYMYIIWNIMKEEMGIDLTQVIIPN